MRPRLPSREGLFEALGKGYVAQVDALLMSTYPGHRIRVVNVGCGGHTVRDLRARWQQDVLDLKPDWVSVMIGTNDVWRQFDLPRQTEIHVHLEEYRDTLEKLVQLTMPLVKGMILITPFYIEPNRSDPMRAQMDRYGLAVKDLAEKYGATFVDTQRAFDAYTCHFHSSSLAWDRVHPNQTGHMIITRAILDALGFEWQAWGESEAAKG